MIDTLCIKCYNLFAEEQALLFYKVCGKTMAFSENYTDYEMHGSIQKLVSVFASCTDIDQAYDILKNMWI